MFGVPPSGGGRFTVGNFLAVIVVAWLAIAAK